MTQHAAPHAHAFDLEALLAQQEPSAKSTSPSIPVKHALAEALRLQQEATKLRARLLEAPGFDPAHLDRLGPLTEALQTAENAWHTGQGNLHAHSLVAARHEAEQLKSKLVATARYLFRKEPAALEVIDGMAHGTSLVDLVADLNGLGAFVAEHQAVFTAAKQPADLAAKAKALAKTLAAGTDKTESVDLQARRNQVFLLLQEAVDEVRAAARFVLHDEPEKLAPMLSSYASMKSRRDRAAKKATPTPPAGTP